jgi:O-antigen/teichoic acid export membrane protein
VAAGGPIGLAAAVRLIDADDPQATGRDELDTSDGVAGGPSAEARSSRFSLVARFGWGLGDQLLSSLTNFVLSLFVARSVSLSDLGAFTLAYSAYAISLGAVRAIPGQILVVRHSAVSTELWREGVRGAAGTAVTLGAVVGGGCIVAGVLLGGALRNVLGILGVALPILLMQDVWRYAFFARGRGGAAFLNDLTWAVAMFATFAGLSWTHVSSVAWFTSAWAAAGCVAAGVGLLQLGVTPSGPVTAIRWLKRNRDLAPRFVAEFGISTGVSNLTVFAMGGVMGLDELGQLRAAQIAIAPLNILAGGTALAATPEAVRFLRESPKRLVQACRVIALIQPSGALVWGAVLLFAPPELGHFILGANWDAARSLLLPLLIWAGAFGSSFGPWAGLRALAAAKRSLRARSIDAIAGLVLSLGGAYVGGAVGAAWGTAAAGCLMIPNAWWQFSRALQEYEYRRDARHNIASESVSELPRYE